MPQIPGAVSFEELDDQVLFQMIGKLYDFGPIVASNRGPRRQGRPGLVSLTAADGRRVAIKQHNVDGQVVERARQKDMEFQSRCVAIGIPAPRPVLTPDGTHGSVSTGWRSAYGVDHMPLTASEWVDGVSLETAMVGPAKAQDILREVGRSAALMRVASRDVGPLHLFPVATAKALLQKADHAEERGEPWADQLRKAAPLLALTVTACPVGWLGDSTFAAPCDLAPKDVLLTPLEDISFVDWELVEANSWTNAVGDGNNRQWLDWASRQGIPNEAASELIEGTFLAELARHPHSGQRLSQDAARPFIRSVERMLGDMHLALLESTVLPQIKIDSSLKMPASIETAMDAAHALRPLLQAGRFVANEHSELAF